MIDERQRRLMELARDGEHRLERPPEGEDYLVGSGEIRSCGDSITLYIGVAGGRVVEARYEGAGCALALASAELLCGALAGSELAEAERFVAWERRYLAGEPHDPPLPRSAADFEGGEPSTYPDIGLLEPLSIVREHPARRSCVLLAFDCAISALQGLGTPD